MPNICVDCFSDRELISYINSRPTPGDCEFCTAKGVNCILIEELYGFFDELLIQFKPKAGGIALRSLIQAHWGLFRSPDNASVVLNHVIAKGGTPFLSADHIVDFSDEILENTGYWDVLKVQLLTKSRYITRTEELIDLGWDGFFSNPLNIPIGSTMYRARLHHKSGEAPYPMVEMFCPPAAIASAGRANPSGIPYLYLSDNPDTVLYETRAAYLDEISVGTFEVIDRPLLVADFTEVGGLYHATTGVGDRIKSSLLMKKISADLSKPMRRYDTDLDYVPTQFICEFIKIFAGAEGIKFRSSLHVTGFNFVIFDQTRLNCKGVNQVKVSRVVIEAQPIHP